MYNRTTVTKHDIPVKEFKRLKPTMKESRIVALDEWEYYEGHIEIRAEDNILVIQLFSEDIK